MPDNPSADNTGQDAPSAQFHVGELLSSQREKLGMSLQDCSDVLKIPRPKLEALEKGNLDAFDSALFLRGYLRSYAKLLHLSEQAVLRQYDEKQGADQDVVIQKPLTSTSSSVGRWWLPYIIGLMVVLLWFLLSDYLSQAQAPINESVAVELEKIPLVSSTAKVSEDNKQESVFIEDADVEEKPPVIQKPLLQAETTDVVKEQLAESSPSDLMSAELTVTVNTIDENNSINEIAAIPNAVESAHASLAVDTNAEQGDDRIYFTFNEECWVEITDADNNVIVSSLRQANTDLTVIGKAPFSVILGNINGTTVNYRGKEIPLTGSQDGRTLRLDLDN